MRASTARFEGVVEKGADAIRSFVIFNSARRGEDDGRATKTATAGADQSGREGIAGTVCEPRGDPSHDGRVHDQFHLRVSDGAARKTGGEHDREPDAREAPDARDAGERDALR